jgi:DNA-binding NarL/FixJ family response regulator
MNVPGMFSSTTDQRGHRYAFEVRLSKNPAPDRAGERWARCRLTSADRLTKRERQVLDGLDRGLRDKEIAQELGLSLSTVRTYVGSAVLKLGATTRVQAIGIYISAWRRRRRAGRFR